MMATPPYLCFLGGTTFEQLSGEGDVAQGVNMRVVFASLAFVLGFTTVFIALGATATFIGQLVAENLDLLAKIGGVAIDAKRCEGFQIRLDAGAARAVRPGDGEGNRDHGPGSIRRRAPAPQDLLANR